MSLKMLETIIAIEVAALLIGWYISNQ